MYDMIHIYAELARGFEKGFDSSNYGVKRPLLIRKNKKVIRLMKNELGERIMK